MIAVVGAQPPWLEVVRQSADQLLLIDERVGYVPHLADALVALILVNGADPAWRFWTVTPKSSPATRRIPIILVTDDPQTRLDALTVGADLTVNPADLPTQIGQLVQDYARVFDAEKLDRCCEDELPPLAQQGVEKFNAGEYYPQHDLFEAQWVQTEGPIRDLYRAILQVGVAYYQIERGNHRGALKMLLRSVQWLAILPDVCQGVDVRQLREDSYRVRVALESIDSSQIGQFDRQLLKPLQIIKFH